MIMKKLKQSTVIMIALILGAIFGLLAPTAVPWISFIGDIFLKLVQMSLPLLVLGQVAVAVARINLKELGRMGGHTLAQFLIVTLTATLWGAAFAFIFKPGVGIDMTTVTAEAYEPVNQTLWDVIVGFVPKNIFVALTEGNMMQVTLFSLFLGAAISLLMHERQKNMQTLSILDELNDIVMKIMSLVMKTAPIGVFSLTSSAFSKQGIQVLMPLMYYVVVFLLANLTFILFWHLIQAMYTKQNFWKLVRGTFNMSAFAFSVNSSAVALSTQMRDSENILGVSEEVSSFVNPLGLSLNSPGSAMSNAFVLVMAGQMYNINWGLADYFMIIMIGFFVSYASANIPGGGLVSLNMVMTQMGFGAEVIGVLATVDYPTGMTRSMTNVNLDATTAVMVAYDMGELDQEVLDHYYTK